MEDTTLGVVVFVAYCISVICVIYLAPEMLTTYVGITGPMVSIILAFYFSTSEQIRTADAAEALFFITSLLIVGLIAILFLWYVIPHLPKLVQFIRLLR